MHFVHVVNVADDGGTLFDGDDRAATLGHFQNVIVHDACNKVVAVFLSLAENLEVAVVEKVVGACGVANNHGASLWLVAAMGIPVWLRYQRGEKHIRGLG